MHNKILFLNAPLTQKGDRYRKSIAFGQLMIASALSENDTSIKLENFSVLGESGLREVLSDFRPHIIGITLYETLFEQTISLVQLLRSCCKDVTIAIGGPMTTLEPAKSLFHTGADIAFKAEGEETFKQALPYMHYKEYLNSDSFPPPGTTVISRSNNHVNSREDASYPQPFLTSEQINSIEIRWELCSHLVHNGFLHMSTSRGCPNRCVFCAKYIKPVPRSMTAEKIKWELDQIQKIQRLDKFPAIRFLSFDDDNFAFDRTRILEFAEVIDEKPAFEISIQSSINDFFINGQIDYTLIHALKKLNVTQIAFGTESFCNKELERMNKHGYQLKHIFEIIKTLEFHDIRNTHYLIFSNYNTPLEDAMTSTYITTWLMLTNKRVGCFVNSTMMPTYSSNYYQSVCKVSTLNIQSKVIGHHNFPEYDIFLLTQVLPKDPVLRKAICKARIRTGRHNHFRNPIIPWIYFSTIGKNIKRHLKTIIRDSPNTTTSNLSEIQRLKKLMIRWKVLNILLLSLKLEKFKMEVQK